METGAAGQILPFPMCLLDNFKECSTRFLYSHCRIEPLRLTLSNSPWHWLSLSYFTSSTLDSVPSGSRPKVNYVSHATVTDSALQVNHLEAVPVTWSVACRENCEARSLRDSGPSSSEFRNRPEFEPWLHCWLTK